MRGRPSSLRALHVLRELERLLEVLDRFSIPGPHISLRQREGETKTHCPFMTATTPSSFITSGSSAHPAFADRRYSWASPTFASPRCCMPMKRRGRWVPWKCRSAVEYAVIAWSCSPS